MTKIPSSCTFQRARLIAGALFFSGFALTGGAAVMAAGNVITLSGPARVVDGDTLEVAGQRIRLEGIDAPELSQNCTAASGTEWNCGGAAAQALRRLISNKDIACDSRGLDKYGRMLGVCFEEGLEINSELVTQGFAWAFIKYSQSYVAAERVARAAKAGIWQGPALPAWEYRHKQWASAEPAAPAGCAIKGNVSGKGRIFHTPWSPWYGQVTIDPGRGEHWFCSEGEALAAGWRPASGS